MKYFFETRLGETRYRLADSSLLCKNVPIARTGTQVYSAEDLPNLKPNAAGEIIVRRSPEQVFDPATLASFEGMSITVLHPEDAEGNVRLINPQNWKELAHGHIQNVRRGTGDQSDLMLADIIVKDEYAIQLIEEGLRQVSCGSCSKRQSRKSLCNWRQRHNGNSKEKLATAPSLRSQDR